MKKIIAVFTVLTVMFSISLPTAMAGTLNGNLTKIRAYEQGNKVRFESRIPKLDIIVRKGDIIKAMTRFGKTTAVVKIERDGRIIEIDRKIVAKLNRVGDGLYIHARNVDMFITEKELDNVKKMR